MAANLSTSPEGLLRALPGQEVPWAHPGSWDAPGGGIFIKFGGNVERPNFRQRSPVDREDSFASMADRHPYARSPIELHIPRLRRFHFIG
jgi:hypothetical protein